MKLTISESILYYLNLKQNLNDTSLAVFLFHQPIDCSIESPTEKCSNYLDYIV